MREKSTQLPLFASDGSPHPPTAFFCEVCCTSFHRHPSDLTQQSRRGSRPRFCSRRCQGIAKRSRRPLICDACGMTFLRHQSEIGKWAKREGTRVFCSKACEADARRVGEAEERTCETCGRHFVIQPSATRHARNRGEQAGRFCSFACSRPALARERRRGIEVRCAACGTPIRRTAATLNDRNFCSYACMGTLVPTWTNGGRGINGIRADLGHRCRSRWEANVCRILIAMRLAYEYEPRVFRMGEVSYTPDLWIPVWSCWIEVKGWLMPAAAAKMDAFRAAYPNERLVMIDRPMYEAMEREWAHRLPNWERFVPKRHRQTRTKVTPAD